jgi:hypothetical protein
MPRLVFLALLALLAAESVYKTIVVEATILEIRTA